MVGIYIIHRHIFLSSVDHNKQLLISSILLVHSLRIRYLDVNLFFRFFFHKGSQETKIHLRFPGNVYVLHQIK